MKRRIFSILACIMVISLALCGCEDKKATISKEEKTTQAVTEPGVIESGIVQSGVTEVKALDNEKSRISRYMDIVNGGTFTLSGTVKNHSMGLVSDNPITISALGGEKYHYDVFTVAARQEYLITDGKAYVLNDVDKTYAECESKTIESVKSGINTYLPSLTTLKYLDTYEVEYNGESYVRERYELKNNVGEEQTVSYFFDGDTLKIIRHDSNILETILESDLSVLEFVNTAEEYEFEIPKDYKKITETELEMNKNNTASSDEYILALFDSLGVTDEDLSKMGYTREQVLNMDEAQRSIFLAELFGEDFE